MYKDGGLFSVTSRILIVDMLKKTIPVHLITGLVVLHAEEQVWQRWCMLPCENIWLTYDATGCGQLRQRLSLSISTGATTRYATGSGIEDPVGRS